MSVCELCEKKYYDVIEAALEYGKFSKVDVKAFLAWYNDSRVEVKAMPHKPSATRGCNLCDAHMRASRKGEITEPFQCGACHTSYKVSKK